MEIQSLFFVLMFTLLSKTVPRELSRCLSLRLYNLQDILKHHSHVTCRAVKYLTLQFHFFLEKNDGKLCSPFYKRHFYTRQQCNSSDFHSWVLQMGTCVGYCQWNSSILSLFCLALTARKRLWTPCLCPLDFHCNSIPCSAPDYLKWF